MNTVCFILYLNNWSRSFFTKYRVQSPENIPIILPTKLLYFDLSTFSGTCLIFSFYLLLLSFLGILCGLSRYFTWWMEMYQIKRLVLKSSIKIQYKKSISWILKKNSSSNSRYGRKNYFLNFLIQFDWNLFHTGYFYLEHYLS